MIAGCPGAGRFKEPYPEEIACRSCGKPVEIWSDETQAICPSCGATVSRGNITSCLDWCRSAKECIGTERYQKYLAAKYKG